MRQALMSLLLLVAWTSPASGEELQGTLKKIRDSGTMVLGHREASPPFSFLGKNQKPAGYSVDLCTRIATAVQQHLGLPDLQIKWAPVTPQNRISMVVEGAIDLECGSTTNTLSRQEQVDFTHLTFIDGAALLVTKESRIMGIGDLGGKRVAVARETTTERALERALQESYVNNAQVVKVGDHGDGLAALERGTIDAYASDRIILVGLALAARNRSKLTLVDQYFSYEPYGFMLRRGDAAFRLVVNRTLSRIYRTGQIQGIYQKWFGAMGKPSGLLKAMYVLHALPE